MNKLKQLIDYDPKIMKLNVKQKWIRILSLDIFAHINTLKHVIISRSFSNAETFLAHPCLYANKS